MHARHSRMHGGGNFSFHRWGPHPGRGFRHSRLRRGFVINPFWFSPQFHVQNWQVYGFSDPGADGRWVRYYDDAYLIDQGGRVRDTRYGMDWDRYGEQWGDDDGVPAYRGHGEAHGGEEHGGEEHGEEYAEREEHHGARGHGLARSLTAMVMGAMRIYGRRLSYPTMSVNTKGGAIARKSPSDYVEVRQRNGSAVRARAEIARPPRHPVAAPPPRPAERG